VALLRPAAMTDSAGGALRICSWRFMHITAAVVLASDAALRWDGGVDFDYFQRQVPDETFHLLRRWGALSLVFLAGSRAEHWAD
jgi:hypothetical protein